MSNNISTDEVKQLRSQTGVSVMQCKKALEEADGDMETAKVIIQRKSKEAANKKAERELGAGVVEAYIHNTKSMVELSCETDFVANNDEFQRLAYDIAMHVAAQNPQYLTKEDIPEDDKERAKEAMQSELEGTPEDKRDQILEGKLDAYFQEQILLQQPFVKDANVTILNLIEQAIQKFGENIQLTRFTRFALE